jgi:AcrR family transcriptional regulator
MGRARTFDTDEALDRAMEVFWRSGFEGASLTDLTEAMGIERPSMYAAFGNKEQLFVKALDRYVEVPSAYVGEALAEKSCRTVMERLLAGAADLQTSPDTPPGCMMVQGAASCEAASPVVREALAESRLGGEALIRERFERAAAEGDLPAGVDAAELAKYVRTVTYGMAVRAAAGATREELEPMIRMTMAVWPD